MTIFKHDAPAPVVHRPIILLLWAGESFAAAPLLPIDWGRRGFDTPSVINVFIE